VSVVWLLLCCWAPAGSTKNTYGSSPCRFSTAWIIGTRCSVVRFSACNSSKTIVDHAGSQRFRSGSIAALELVEVLREQDARVVLAEVDEHGGPQARVRPPVVAEVTDRLRADGWQSYQIARASIVAGLASGNGSPDDVRRALAAIRKERRRHRESACLEERLLRRTTIIEAELFGRPLTPRF
jgi:hypothetical protein